MGESGFWMRDSEGREYVISPDNGSLCQWAIKFLNPSFNLTDSGEWDTEDELTTAQRLYNELTGIPYQNIGYNPASSSEVLEELVVEICSQALRRGVKHGEPARLGNLKA